MTAADWVDDRTGVRRILRRALHERLPAGVNWWFTFGSVLLLLLVVQAVTGAALVAYYVPAPVYAWESVEYVMSHVTFGGVLRGLHVFGASFLVIAAVAHLVRVVAFGAYKRPREVTWWSGVALLFVVLGFALTGYLLPWDQRAYWATVVTINIARTAPVAGPWIAGLLQGGTHVGALTLTRWFAIHVILLPASAIVLVTIHLVLMRRHGIAGPVRRRPGPGRPFYPEHVFRDAVVCGVVFAALIGLAVFVRAPLAAVADPADTTYVPRPEWYFLSLFQLLKYFPGRLEPLAAHGVPALVVLALVLLPFLDRGDSREPRARRGVIAATAIVLGAVVALTALGMREVPAATSADTRSAGGALSNPRALFAARCAGCHTLDGVGGRIGPDLSHVGRRRDEAWMAAWIAEPSAFKNETEMPAFRGKLPDAEIRELASWLAARR